MWTNTQSTYGWFKFYIMLPLPQICAQECSKGWYFQCKVVSRTVGCCARFAAVLWYLGYQRHQTGEVLSQTKYILDAADTDWDSKYRINLYMHDDYRFYTRCLDICITIFIYFFKSEMIFINITMQILYIFINIFDALMRF